MRRGITFKVRDKRIIVLGAVYELNVEAVEWLDRRKTQIGVFPPQILSEGISATLWGYSKLHEPTGEQPPQINQ